MRIVIPELLITNPVINSHRSLVFRVTVKEGDYDKAISDAVYDCADNGTPMASVFEPFQQEKQESDMERLSRKRQVLGALMEKYAEKEGMILDMMVDGVYAKYKVGSRKDLTEEQLDYEIESYRAGLNYNQ